MTDEPFQVMPPLTTEEYDALLLDIAERGVLVPVVVDQHDRIIDGHHRKRACDELGIDCPTETRIVRDDEDARDAALTMNTARRHLTQEQRRRLILSELTHNPDRSDRAIGRLLGVDGKTVAAIRRAIVEHEQAERDRRVAQAQAHIRDRIQGAALAEMAVWARWVGAHDEGLARRVLAGESLTLAEAAGMIPSLLGCWGLGCVHAPNIALSVADGAEIPHLPTPPLKWLGSYRVHRACDVRPLVPDDEFALFVESVRDLGLLHPIVLTHDRSTLVDGRIRYLACGAAGVEPTFTTLPEGYTDSDIVTFILSTEERTHLSRGQVAAATALAELVDIS